MHSSEDSILTGKTLKIVCIYSLFLGNSQEEATSIIEIFIITLKIGGYSIYDSSRN